MKTVKLLTYALLFAVWMFVPLPLMAETFIDENFDSPGFTSGIPDGWDNSQGTTSYVSYKWSYYGIGREGACLRFNSYTNSSGNTNVLMSPEFTVPSSASDLVLKFYFKNTQGGDLTVSVTSDGGLTFTDLETGLVASQWTLKEYPMSDYAGQTIRVAWRSTSNCGSGDAYHYLDDVELKSPDLCAQPGNFSISAISQNEVTVNWQLGVAEAYPDKYRLNVTKVSDGTAVISNNALVPVGESTTLSGLEAGTEYRLTLRSDCNSSNKGLSSESAPFHFTTLLDPIALPYSLDFNGSNELPIGLVTHGDVELTSTPNYGGSGNCIAIRATATDAAIVVFPQMDHFSNDLQFAAMVRGNAEKLPYSIGLMSDPLDLSTFIPVHEDAIPKSSEWYDLRFNTGGLASPQKKLSFAVMLPNSKTASVYLDNIVISAIPTCPRPEKLTVVTNDSVQATLGWNSISTPILRQVRLVAGTDTTYQTLTANPGTITGLAFNTQYTVWVREACSAGDTSEWSLPAQFRTHCGIYSDLPYLVDFNDGVFPSCWSQRQVSAGTGTFGSDYGDNAWEPYKKDGRPCVSLRDQRAGIRTNLIVQPIYIDQAGKYDLEYMQFRSTGTKSNEGIVAWISNTPDTVGAQKCEFIHNGHTLSPAEENSGWYKYSYNIQRSGVVYIIFDGTNQYGSAMYIDDVAVVTAPSCRPYKGRAELSDITQTSVKLTWDKSAEATTTLLSYMITSSTDTISDTVQVDVTAADNFEHTFTGLTQATGYTLRYRIANLCGVADTSEWTDQVIKTFATQCERQSLPLKLDFEQASLPLCWSVYSDGAKEYWKINTSASYVSSGTKSLMLVDHRGYEVPHPLFVSPLLDMPDADYQLQFSMYRRGKSSYTTSDPNDTTEGVRVWVNTTPDTVGGTVICYMRSNKEVVPVKTYVGVESYVFNFHASGDSYIVFEGIADHVSATYIDDIELRLRPACEDIKNSFAVNALSDSELQIVIDDPNATVDTWQAEYGFKGFTLGEGTQTAVFSGDTAVISALRDSTEYDVYIRRVCNDTYSDNWKGPQSAATWWKPIVVDATHEFFEGFEGYDENAVIGDYFIDVVQSGKTWKESTAMKKFEYTGYYGDKTSITAYEGNRFSKQQYSYYQIRYIPVQLTANTNYEVSGYFTQDDNDATTTLVSLVYSDRPVWDGATELAKEYVIDEWKHIASYFTVPADGVYYVGAKIEQNYSPYASGMDNLRIRVVSCIPPTSSIVSQITTSSARMDWVSDATEWQVRVFAGAIEHPDSTENLVFCDTVTDKWATVTGLTENTEYNYIIRSVCDGTPSDWSKANSFRTNCQPAEVPYILDFEDPKLEEMLCWTPLGEEYSYSYSTSTKHEGLGALRITTGSFISPQLVVNSLADYMITGYAYATKDSVAFSVGIMVDPDDESTFESLGTVMIPVKNKWQEFTAYFNKLSTPDYEDFADAKYIVLTFSTPDVSFYLDDVLVDVIPTCPKPTEPSISEVTATSFKVGWTTNADESQWLVSIASVGRPTIDTVVNTNPFVMTGLRSATAYEVSVRAICSATDTSRVTECGALTTLCAVQELPWAMDLAIVENKLPKCWTRGSSTASSYSDWCVRADKGTDCLYFDDYASYTPKYSSILSPEIAIDAAIAAELTANIKNYKSGDLEIIIHDAASSASDTIATIASSDKEEYKRYVFDIPAQYSGKTIQVELRITTSSSYSPKVCVRSISIAPQAACKSPVEVIFEASTGTTMTFSIVDTIAEHTAWEYRYVEAGGDIALAEPVATDANQFQIGNLSASTRYSVQVRANCGNGDYSNWTDVSFGMTLCAPHVLPYYEGFENYTTETLGDGCFQILNSLAGGSYPKAEITSATYLSEGSKGLKMFSSETEPLYFVLPDLADSLKNVIMQFDYRNESTESASNSPLVVGYMTSAVDMSTFVPVYTCPLTATFTTVTIPFDTVAAIQGNFDGFIAFRYGTVRNNWFCGLDNIRVISSTNCMPVKEIEMLEAGESSVKLHLSAYSPAAEYEVAYGIGSASAEACTARQVVTSDTVVINGLASGSIYNVFARSICGANDTSEWSEAKFVQTPCGTYPLPRGSKYEENFDTYNAANPFPTCLFRLKTSKEYPAIDESTYASSGNHVLHFKGKNAVVLPRFDADMQVLKLSFNAKAISGTYIYVGTTNLLNIDSVKSFGFFWVSSYNGVETKMVDFNEMEDIDGDYLVLYTVADDANVIIDDLLVEWGATCKEAANLKVSGITDTSAVMTWEGCYDATVYDYVLLSGTDTVAVGNTAAETVTFDTLDAVTAYTFKVRVFCGEMDTTDWKTVSFTTKPTPGAVPFSTGFESDADNANWILANSAGYSDKFIIGTDPVGVKDGTKALYISDNDSAYKYTGPDFYYDYWGDYDYERETMFAYRVFMFEKGQYEIKFDWKGTGGYSNFGHVFVMADSLADLKAGNTSYTTQSVTLSSQLKNQNTWQHDSMTVTITEPDVYRLAVAWDQSYGPSSTSTPLAIDNISIERVECMSIVNLEQRSVTNSEAMFTFYNGNDDKLTAYYCLEGTDTVAKGTVINDTIELTGLTTQTTYRLYVSSVCGEMSTVWETAEFMTTCEPTAVTAESPYFEGFEDYVTDESPLDVCWTETSTYGSAQWKVKTTWGSGYREPYEGSNYAYLRFSNTRTMQREFLLEKDKAYSISYMAKVNATLGNDYVEIVINHNGKDTVLTRMNATTEWTMVSAEYTAPEQGVYTIGIKGDLTYKPDYLCVDNFSIDQTAYGTPTNLTVSGVTPTEAQISWTGTGTRYQLQITTADNTVVVDSIFEGMTFHATGLSASTYYKVSVRSNEEDGTSKWSKTDFMTECDVVTVPAAYSQDFTGTYGTIPQCWEEVSSTFEGSNYVVWQGSSDGGNDVAQLTLAYASGVKMLRTVPIHLTGSDHMLSFDYRNQSTETLNVIISRDGTTFTDTILSATQNATRETFTYNLQNYAGDTITVAFMTNATKKVSGTYMYVDNFRVNCQGEEVVYNIPPRCPGEAYVGYGFDIPANKLTENGVYEYTRLHQATSAGECDYVEKLVLNIQGGGVTVLRDTICEGDVYSDDVFKNLTVAGRYEQTLESSLGCDSTIRLFLEVANPRYSYSDTICDNQTYTFGGKELTKPGIYTDTIKTTSSCDSIVTLTLTVLQTRFEEEMTVCKGTSHIWLDTVLATTGVYERRYTNHIGCDSVYVIDFTVLEDQFTVDSTICYGKSVIFGTESHSVTGTYVVNFENYLGCDSVVTLNLTVTAPDTVAVEDISCEGHLYTGNGYINLEVTKDTVLFNPVKDAEGCITVTRVELDFVETVRVDTTVTIQDGEVYNFCGNSYTEAGTYVCDNLKTEQGCDSVVTLHLVVSTGVDMTKVQSLVLAPNPVRRGEVSYIHRTWTAEEQDGMVIETVNSLGQVIARETPDQFPIAVSTASVSGVYYIRIITGTGDVYIGGLVVK